MNEPTLDLAVALVYAITHLNNGRTVFAACVPQPDSTLQLERLKSHQSSVFTSASSSSDQPSKQHMHASGAMS